MLLYKNDDGDVGNIGEPRFPTITTSLTHTYCFSHKNTLTAYRLTWVTCPLGRMELCQVPLYAVYVVHCVLNRTGLETIVAAHCGHTHTFCVLLLCLDYYQCHINPYRVLFYSSTLFLLAGVFSFQVFIYLFYVLSCLSFILLLDLYSTLNCLR